MKKTDAFLLAALQDKIDQCLAEDDMTTSVFLDMHQRTIAEQLCRGQSVVQFCFWGGYATAERTLACFFPKYWGLKTAEDAVAWLENNEEESPIILLQAIYQGENSFGHRDYLGALMNLGIERNVLGDILVHSDGAQVLVLRKILPYLLQNWQKVGRANIILQQKNLGQLVLPLNHMQEKWDTVASCRLDNVLSAAFDTSRKSAAEAIQSGLIFVNGLERWKADSLVQVGDRLVWRGKGKVILQQIGEKTRKGRFPIVMQKYGS